MYECCAGKHWILYWIQENKTATCFLRSRLFTYDIMKNFNCNLLATFNIKKIQFWQPVNNFSSLDLFYYIYFYFTFLSFVIFRTKFNLFFRVKNLSHYCLCLWYWNTDIETYIVWSILHIYCLGTGGIVSLLSLETQLLILGCASINSWCREWQ